MRHREDARLICKKGLIKLNCNYVKPAKDVKPGDLIEMETTQGTRKIKILKIPEGDVRKEDVGHYYEEVGE